jgi:calcium-dependent protein kinase
LKPENIIFDCHGNLKIAGFSLAAKVPEYGSLNEFTGTPHYTAPEIYHGKYSIEADVWSLGVIFYILVSGYHPFRGNTTAEVKEKIIGETLLMETQEWDSISDEAKDLISKLLIKNPNSRFTIE